MKLPMLLRIGSAALIATVFAFGLYRCATGDYSGKPEQRQLAYELAMLSQALGGQARYVQRVTWVGMYGISENVEDISKLLHSNGWTESAPQSGSELKFCKERMALLVEPTREKGRRALEYGIYWSSDRGSKFYCAPIN